MLLFTYGKVFRRPQNAIARWPMLAWMELRENEQTIEALKRLRQAAWSADDGIGAKEAKAEKKKFRYND